MKPWRGVLVILTWIVWPLLYPAVETLLRMMLSTSRRCSIEGCSPPAGLGAVVSYALWFGVPLLVTLLWIRWRKRVRINEWPPNNVGAGRSPR
jgi:hypothetical protein